MTAELWIPYRYHCFPLARFYLVIYLFIYVYKWMWLKCPYVCIAYLSQLCLLWICLHVYILKYISCTHVAHLLSVGPFVYCVRACVHACVCRGRWGVWGVFQFTRRKEKAGSAYSHLVITLILALITEKDFRLFVQWLCVYKHVSEIQAVASKTDILSTVKNFMLFRKY